MRRARVEGSTNCCQRLGNALKEACGLAKTAAAAFVGSITGNDVSMSTLFVASASVLQLFDYRWFKHKHNQLLAADVCRPRTSARWWRDVEWFTRLNSRADWSKSLVIVVEKRLWFVVPLSNDLYVTIKRSVAFCFFGVWSCKRASPLTKCCCWHFGCRNSFFQLTITAAVNNSY